MISDKLSTFFNTNSVESLKELVKALEEFAETGDHEKAHGIEDTLREHVLSIISKSDCQYAEMAEIALSTSEIDFDRWCS